MVRAISASLITLMSYGAFGQSPQVDLDFGEVLIRPASKGPKGFVRPQADGLTGTNVTMRQLVLFSNEGLHSAQLSGPSWIETERYDITAKAKGPVTTARLQLMLQALLADRFKLKSHRESNAISVYGLVVAKGGPKLRDSTEGKAAFDARTKDGKSPFKPGLIGIFTSKDIPGFAERLGRPLDRPVIDKTGIKGLFWFELEWAPDSGAAEGWLRAGPSLESALEAQLGLRLEPQRSSMDVLVIDQLEKPADN